MGSTLSTFSTVAILLISAVMFWVDMLEYPPDLTMKSTGTFVTAWSSACLAMVSAPMLTPAKKVDAKMTPSRSAMYSCHDRIRCLATYEMGNQLACCTGLRSAEIFILLFFLLSLYFRTGVLINRNSYFIVDCHSLSGLVSWRMAVALF